MTTDPISYHSVKFGAGNGRIHFGLGSGSCKGFEYRISDCSYSTGDHDHVDEWSISCDIGRSLTFPCIQNLYISFYF